MFGKFGKFQEKSLGNISQKVLSKNSGCVSWRNSWKNFGSKNHRRNKVRVQGWDFRGFNPYYYWMIPEGVPRETLRAILDKFLAEILGSNFCTNSMKITCRYPETNAGWNLKNTKKRRRIYQRTLRVNRGKALHRISLGEIKNWTTTIIEKNHR